MKIEASLKKVPEHQVTYENVRDLILFGHFSPGHPVTIQGLADQLNADVTPIRESIRRLTTEQALDALGNRRISVPVMTVQKMEDLYFVRESVEPELAARAVNNITSTNIKSLWVKNSEVDRAIESGDIPRYLENNYRFHFELYALAQSETLCQIAQSTWLQLAPFLKVVFGRFGTSNLPDHHVVLLQHLEDANSDGARDALREDLRQGKQIILDNMIK